MRSAAYYQKASDSKPGSLSYDVYDEKGELAIIVSDNDLDGQADLRMHFTPDRWKERWVVDHWEPLP